MDVQLITLIAIGLAFVAGLLLGWVLAGYVAGRRLRAELDKQVEVDASSAEDVSFAPEIEDVEEVPALGVEAADELKIEPEPAGKPEPQKPHEHRIRRPATELGIRLFSAEHPELELISYVQRVKAKVDDPQTAPPSVLEGYLARRLEEAGVLEHGFSLPGLTVVRPQTNGMFFLRLRKDTERYGSVLSMLRVEAALNASVLAEEIFAQRPPQDEKEIYAALDTLVRRIAFERTTLPASDLLGYGEWGARVRLSLALETLRLPYRLSTQFRMNLQDGVAAVEFEVTPLEVFSRSALVEGVGIVPTTHSMRGRAQADYTMRVATLLAQCVFAASSCLERVWVAAIERTPERHSCLLTCTFTREAMMEYYRDQTSDVRLLLSRLGASYAFDGSVLAPCSQGFTLDEERFCPPWRYEPIGLSSRVLRKGEAQALGTDSVSGLEIDEGALRERMAEDIATHLPEGGVCSCEDAVKAVLSCSCEENHQEFRDAVLHTAQNLIDGVLEPEPFAIIDSLCDDNGVSRALVEAQEFLLDGNPKRAEEVLAKALVPLEERALYRDTATDEWRAFSNYVDRVLYNLMLARKGVTTHLVPEAYVEALLTRSVALLACGRGEEALALSRRATAICPMSAIVRLHLVQCLEALGEAPEAREQLIMLLNQAHDQEGLGYGYYRMAITLAAEGKTLAARACYQRALSYMPHGAKEVVQHLGNILIAVHFVNERELTIPEMQHALSQEGIPFAPTREVTEAFMGAARASLDAEVFPVARDFLRVLGSVTRNDVMFGVFRSLEDEPDR